MGNSCSDKSDTTGRVESNVVFGATTSPPANSSPEPTDCPLFVCKYDYDSRTDNDLEFKKGDLVYVISTDNEDWWLARLKDSRREGYIPSNYVIEWQSKLDVEEWYFGKLKRVDAERLLMKDGNQIGSYLVYETGPSKSSLAIRDVEKVRHYRIRCIENGTSSTFFITRRATFVSIQDLVAYHQNQSDGLCSNLKFPCMPSEKPQTASLSKQTNEEMEIDRRQIRLQKKLGSGQLGTAWEGVWNGTTSVAVKTLKTTGFVSNAEFLEEANLMRKLRHPNLVQVYAVSTSVDPIYLIKKKKNGGSLLDHLRTKGRSLEQSKLIDMCSQIAEGMAYIESQNYIHLNLNAKNILLTENMTCKVADFGLNRLIIDDDLYSSTKFPLKWTAPEGILYNRLSIKSDVWSFGIVLYEVITYGRLPYPGIIFRLDDIVNGYRMPCPSVCPEKLHQIMLKCWMEEPSCRPTFETLQWQLEDFYVEHGEPEQRTD